MENIISIEIICDPCVVSRPTRLDVVNRRNNEIVAGATFRCYFSIRKSCQLADRELSKMFKIFFVDSRINFRFWYFNQTAEEEEGKMKILSSSKQSIIITG